MENVWKDSIKVADTLKFKTKKVKLYTYAMNVPDVLYRLK
jgi:hypothetical protein